MHTVTKEGLIQRIIKYNRGWGSRGWVPGVKRRQHRSPWHGHQPLPPQQRQSTQARGEPKRGRPLSTGAKIQVLLEKAWVPEMAEKCVEVQPEQTFWKAMLWKPEGRHQLQGALLLKESTQWNGKRDIFSQVPPSPSIDRLNLVQKRNAAELLARQRRVDLWLKGCGLITGTSN